MSGGQNAVDVDGTLVGEGDVALQSAVPGALIEISAVAAILR